MSYSRIACCGLSLLVTACFLGGQSAGPRNAGPADSTVAKPGAKAAPDPDRATTEVAKIAAISTDTLTDGAVRRSSESVGPFVVDGEKFTVALQNEYYGRRQHVRSVQIRDERGVVHHEQRFEPKLRGNQPEWTMTINAYALRGDAGEGLLIYYKYQPSAPMSGVTIQIFALDEDELEPIAPPLSVYGSFAELQKSSDPRLLFLLPADRLDVEVWQGYFGIVIPFRVRLTGCTRGTCIRPASRRGDIVPGLSILNVTTHAREITADTSVVLFDGPEGRLTARVPVRRTSRVTIIEGAADVFIEPQGDVNIIRTRREWLHVRINGRQGWISGAESYTAIGLKAIG
jgi:hypothetical protein